MHVVAGVAPDQRFGGISRVALDLAREQLRAGHQVRLLSTAVGFARPFPREVDGVPVRLSPSLHLVPALGFATIFSPLLIADVAQMAREADVVHFHLARELNTPLALLLASRVNGKIVVQTHGMLDAPRGLLAKIVDIVLVGPALRRTKLALTLISEEDRVVSRYSHGQTRAIRFPNGISLQTPPARMSSYRRSVLFLARLHPRKGALEFARAAVSLVDEFTELRFDIVGPDEGDGKEVTKIAARGVGRVTYHGAVAHQHVSAFMQEALIYCLPARNEPFGLTLLEAMAAGTPVLLSDSAVLAQDIERAGAGWTFDDARDSLEATLRDILSDRNALSVRGANAARYVRESFALDALARRLDDIYLDVSEN